MKADMTTAQFREQYWKEMSEAEFQQWIIDYAREHGWLCAHFRSVKVETGHGTRYMTPVQADGKGFPDLVLARDRVLFVEVKRQNGILSPEQVKWEKAIRTGKSEWFTWRPSDKGNIERILARKP